METNFKPQKICVMPFGCQMNRADAGAMGDLLVASGHTLVANEDDADVIVYVTCTVRQHAENRAISRLGRHGRRKRDGKQLILVLAGCVAEKEARFAFDRVPELDIVCGTRSFHLLPDLIEQVQFGNTHLVAVGLEGQPEGQEGSHFRTTNFQAFVNITRGCDNFCSYCIVPYVRGREYSRPEDEIIEEVRMLAETGVLEVTFLGQNVNSYGKGLLKPASLATLLTRASEIPGIERLKFITSHPKDLTPALIEALKIPKVSPYLHLPAQSGSNRILGAMNRHYTREHYLGLLDAVRHAVPDIGLASDFIVGFPGETEDDYLQTREIMEHARFQQVFIFKYSSRPGTAGAKLHDDVTIEDKKRRNNELLALHMQIATEDNAKQVGKVLNVLVEGPSPRDKSRLIGRSPSDRIVIVSSDLNLAGKIIPVKITMATALALYGEPTTA